MRTILNIDIGTQGYTAAPVESVRPGATPPTTPTLFRMGEASSEQGGWTRWGWALLITTFVHAGLLAVGLSASSVEAKVARPEEPELVFLAFAPPPPPPPAGSSAAVAAKPQRARRPSRAHVPRPALVPPTPTPVPKPPEPVAPQIEETPEPVAEAPAVEESTAVAEAPSMEGVGGVIGGVVGGVIGGVVGGREGGLVGATGDAVLELKQVARAPKVLEQVGPRYPRRARAEGIEGLVLVRLIIGVDGRVEPDSTRILRSIPELDEAAIAAVTQWRFTPALGHHGKPVRVRVDVPVQFILK